MAFQIPKIPKEKLVYTPYLVCERFKEELDSFIEAWLEAYPRHLTKHDVILRCHALIAELVELQHLERKKKYRWYSAFNDEGSVTDGKQQQQATVN
jgi:hypothetical protein